MNFSPLPPHSAQNRLPGPSTGFGKEQGAFAPLQQVQADAFGLKSSLQRTGSQFANFIRYVGPSPVPGKWEFFWQELKNNYRRSSFEGTDRYLQTLKKDQGTRLKFFTLTALGFTAFRRLQRSFGVLLALTLMTSTVMDSLRTFPKLEEAYQQVKQGNPSQGRQTFRKALDDSFYSIFQDFMKPLAVGGALAMLLGLPATIRGEGSFLYHRVIREGAKLLHVNKNWAPLAKAHQAIGRMTHWGDGICNRLRQSIPLLNWLEH